MQDLNRRSIRLWPVADTKQTLPDGVFRENIGYGISRGRRTAQ